MKSGKIFRSLKDLAAEYDNLQSPVSDSVSIDVDDERILFGRLLSLFEDFTRRPSSSVHDYEAADIKIQREIQTFSNYSGTSDPSRAKCPVPEIPDMISGISESPSISSQMNALGHSWEEDRRETEKLQTSQPGTSQQSYTPSLQSVSTESLPATTTSPTNNQLKSRLVESTSELIEEFQLPRLRETPLLSPDNDSSSSLPSPSSIEAEEHQILEKKSASIGGEFPKESTTEFPAIEIRKVEADFDNRFKLILETFHNIGEIMLFKESDLVVTDPKQFTQELVKNIMDHNILNKSNPSMPEEDHNILYKGIFNKNSFEGEYANTYWTLLEATGLGVELNPLAMFVPLLIMEQTSQEIESAAVQFRESLEQSSYRFACLYDVLNIAGNGIEFFHELTKVRILS